MKANGINAELRLFNGWVFEDETKLYFFNCSECAFAWLVENKPDLLSEDASNWERSKRWCSHEGIDPILAIDKSLIDILPTVDSFIVTMKDGSTNETT